MNLTKTAIMKMKKADIISALRTAGVAEPMLTELEKCTKETIAEFLVKKAAEIDAANTTTNEEDTMNENTTTNAAAENTTPAEKKAPTLSVAEAAFQTLPSAEGISYTTNKKGHVLVKVDGKTAARLRATKKGIYLFPSANMKVLLPDVQWAYHPGWANEYETTLPNVGEAVVLIQTYQGLAKAAAAAKAEAEAKAKAEKLAKAKARADARAQREAAAKAEAEEAAAEAEEAEAEEAPAE